MVPMWITLTDKDGDRIDLRTDKIARIDTLNDKVANACVVLDIPEQSTMWVKETVAEVRAKMAG